jgi:prepilin-type N-terminal cleavage/methylation domain-containing protein
LSQHETWKDEHGFTLMELVVTILIMGLVFSIVAISAWGGWMEGFQVNSSTNQLAADLRQAHSKAMNRLADQTVTLTKGSSEYAMTGAGTLDLDEDQAANLDDAPDEDVAIVNWSGATTPINIVFKGDGSATLPEGASTLTLTVSAADGDPNHDIEISAATSRVKVVP